MFKLFEQIFRSTGKTDSKYSGELVKRATERALDETDARIRILPGYEKQMRPAILHAIDQIMQIVDTLAVPLPMSSASWSSEPLLQAMFSSPERLQEILARDASCRDFVSHNPANTKTVTALLLADYNEKHTFGVDLINDNVMSDVPMTVVSFDNHRLIGLAVDETETRWKLKQRAYDYLLSLVLADITAWQEKREDLQVRRKLLRAKLDIVSRSTGNLSIEPKTADRQELQDKMDHIEAALAAMGADHTVLQQLLDILIGMLGSAEKQLWLESATLYLDAMHILRTPDHPKAEALPLQTLHDAKGNRLAALLVHLEPAALA